MLFISHAKRCLQESVTIEIKHARPVSVVKPHALKLT